MDDYLLLKTVHIVSATILFNTGRGTAFHMWMSHLSGGVPATAVAARNTVIADFLFTTPAVVVQPATGVLLAVHALIPLTEGWLLLWMGLYLVTGGCWLPVVWLQPRMHRLADAALATGTALPDRYYRYAWCWFWLGWPAFGAVMAIFSHGLQELLTPSAAGPRFGPGPPCPGHHRSSTRAKRDCRPGRGRSARTAEVLNEAPLLRVRSRWNRMHERWLSSLEDEGVEGIAEDQFSAWLDESIAQLDLAAGHPDGIGLWDRFIRAEALSTKAEELYSKGPGWEERAEQARAEYRRILTEVSVTPPSLHRQQLVFNRAAVNISNSAFYISDEMSKVANKTLEGPISRTGVTDLAYRSLRLAREFETIRAEASDRQLLSDLNSNWPIYSSSDHNWGKVVAVLGAAVRANRGLNGAPTPCDEAAAHPDDVDRPSPGVEYEQLVGPPGCPSGPPSGSTTRASGADHPCSPPRSREELYPCRLCQGSTRKTQ
jgi:uncharacterized membrane protein